MVYVVVVCLMPIWRVGEDLCDVGMFPSANVWAKVYDAAILVGLFFQ